MKAKTVLISIPEVYSVTRRVDYGRFLPTGGAEQMMRETWEKLGLRFRDAMSKFEEGNRGETQEADAQPYSGV
jgi:hypothetical protein